MNESQKVEDFMNNENSSSELFSEGTGNLPETTSRPQPLSPPPQEPDGKVITEETIIEETQIPDTDACGARSCGEFLKIQREKLDLSYEEVFAATRIKCDMIRALENEDFTQLPQPIYVIAYVKRLCQFYNINNALAREFLDKLRSEISFDVPDDFSKSVKGSDESEENMRRIRNLALVAGAVLFLLLILIIAGVTLVVVNLRQSGHQLEEKAPFNQDTLVELQDKPKLVITELKL